MILAPPFGVWAVWNARQGLSEPAESRRRRPAKGGQDRRRQGKAGRDDQRPNWNAHASASWFGCRLTPMFTAGVL